MSTSILQIPIRGISGEETLLAALSAHAYLIVNVASKCGFTPQYEGLEQLSRKYASRGLVIAGFPANDFAEQEPGTNADIQTFCKTTYDVTFPLFEKITVVGPEKHPLYEALIAAKPAIETPTQELRDHLIEFGVTPNDEPEILWNFEKFLVSSDGAVVNRFSPDVAPDDPVLIGAIEKALQKG